MADGDWQLIGFSAGMAVLSSLLIMPGGLLLAWLLARRQWPGKSIVEAVLSLPLVLPPVVTGLLLLELCGRRGLLGKWVLIHFGIDIVFTWRAVVLALAVMSFPLFLRTVRTAFEQVNPALEQMARTLGAGEWRVFFTITLPLARRGVVAGLLLAFARGLGEFGATIMVAGNIAGHTTTIPVAIYQSVQMGADHHAWLLAGVSAALAFGAVLISGVLVRTRKGYL